ncbi:tRNA uridine(34) 5-carboxymethylaminomethyl modification radical SAM/GNAT enzyme Elp3 [Candidatus Pacearchaeota archaeon]|nr:tRNA uridine(34) 5-carboxymethylaminomethyl modification radical SAM/GNAT enzyme Elp3 [Candidatus Pacearchaeota archaeon]
MRKPSKTLAGVTPIAVMCYPRKCKHGACLYCPSLDVPQSYTPLSPPVIRAKILEYSAKEQVKSRLKAFKLMNHPTNKIELIVMGGTFLDYPVDYQYQFIKECYDALNDRKSRSLEEAKRINETAEHRCVALCIETRPDICSETEIKRMLDFGCTRVELGVQCLDDKIYKKVNRGHMLKEVVSATKRLKNFGFKVGYHIMPGLPGSNPEKDLKMFKKLFKDERFKPDQLKIYPCQVIKGSGLEKLYHEGKYTPYTKEQLEILLVKIMKIIPEYCRVMRIMREIPPVYLSAGTIRIDLRKDVEERLKKDGNKINEIRFREIGFNLRDAGKNEKINLEIKIKKKEYFSSDGKELFLQAVNRNNILFGLLRLRFSTEQEIPELKNSALIREIHVYGKTTAIGERGEIQHTGIGKRLMKEAERIVKKEAGKWGVNKIAVISGVGVREYYRKLGYNLEGSYMVKEI